MYHVMFSNDDVRQMTLDQVDDCFRLGVINEETLLWTEGMVAWETLREAAGLGEPTRNAPAPPRRGSPPPNRRVGRAEPPPRKRASNAARAVSSPEVVTSARPLQASRPVVSQLPPLQPAPLPGQGYQASRQPGHVATPAPSPSPSNGYAYPEQRPSQTSSVVAVRQSTPAPTVSPQQLYQQQALHQTYQAAPATPSSYPAASPATFSSSINDQPRRAAYASGAAYASPEMVGHPAVQQAVVHAPVGHAPAQWGQSSGNPFVQQPVQSAGYWSSPVAAAASAGYVRQNHAFANVPATNSLVPVAASMSPPAFDMSGLDDVPFVKGRGSGIARLQRWVFVLSFFAGAAVVSYRNDYLLQLARSARLERTYLALENKYLGGAPEGTLRALKGVGVDTPGAAANTVWNSTTEIVSPASRNNPHNVELTPPATPDPLDTESRTAQATQPEEAKPSETLEKPSTVEAAAKSGVASSPESAGGSGRAVKPSNVGSSYSVARTAAPTYDTASTPKTTAAPSKAFQESLAKFQASKRAKPAEDSAATHAATRSEPAPKPGTDDFLHMNMRQAIKKKPPSTDSSATSSKRRASKTDYDPLNGDL